MSEKEADIRWEQRFSSYQKAFKKFSEAVLILKDIEEDSDEIVAEILKEGLIQRFEYTHQLAWNVMKDFIYYQGNADIKGSRDATREAFKIGLIENGDIWMGMISNRNKTSHTYDDETAAEIYETIINEYYPAFSRFEKTMEALLLENQNDK